MMDFSSVIDAAIAFLGGVAVLIAGLKGLPTAKGPTKPAASFEAPVHRPIDEGATLPRAA